MDLGFARWRESQRAFGHLENIGLEKSAKPYQIRLVVRGAGNKKGQPRMVDLLLLVGIINMKFRSEEAVLLLSIGLLELF